MIINSSMARLSVVTILVFAMISACFGNQSNTNEMTEDPELILAQAAVALGKGDHVQAAEAYKKLSALGPFQCEKSYGLTLTALLELVDTIGIAANKMLNQSDGFSEILLSNSIEKFIDDLLSPIEVAIIHLETYGVTALESNCSLHLPDGLPIGFHRDGSGYWELRLGYEFDAASIRPILSFFEMMKATILFIKAHELSADDSFHKSIDLLVDSLNETNNGTPSGEPEDEDLSVIQILRIAGGLFDLNPQLLALDDPGRFRTIDNSLELAIKLLYDIDEFQNESGFIPSALFINTVDSDLEDNVLAWLDRDNSGSVSGEDTMLIGVRNYSYTIYPSDYAEDSITVGFAREFGVVNEDGSITQSFPVDNGMTLLMPREDSAELIVDLLHDTLLILGRQMAAVDDPAVETDRFEFRVINLVLQYIYDYSPQLPEYLEFDFGGYLRSELPVRNLLPYWIDHDNDPLTPDQFLIETETNQDTSRHSFTSLNDASHFPDTITFGSLGDLAEIDIKGLQIPEDGIFPSQTKALVHLPYFAWQNPSFGNLLYINTADLPVAGETPDSFELASQYSANKVGNLLLLQWFE